MIRVVDSIFKEGWVRELSKWDKFLLLFKWKKMVLEEYMLRTYVVYYKNLRGKVYIIAVYDVPPNHPNCRCVLLSNIENPEEKTNG